VTSGRRDIQAEILRQRYGSDDYNQPVGEWQSLASIWVSQSVDAQSTRTSDRDQPTYLTTFRALEIDVRHVRAKDRLQVYYGDYEIDAFKRVPGGGGQIDIVCSLTHASENVPGAELAMLHEEGGGMLHEDGGGMLYEDGSTAALKQNHE
jgi:head-tail adaptor